ncbi:MAG: hypothetical protein JW990_03830 [Thermoleophilia bacterium]|nr:hypothetical protein [Thermoleophilia bacterium]
MEYDVYLASSWRNEYYGQVLEALTSEGLSVYNFRRPDGGRGFSWDDIDPAWRDWDPTQLRRGLKKATRAYKMNRQALESSRSLVLLLPCGASAHIEMGMAVAMAKPVAVCVPREVQVQAELMYWPNVTICDEHQVAVTMAVLKDLMPPVVEEPARIVGGGIDDGFFAKPDDVGNGGASIWNSLQKQGPFTDGLIGGS